MFQNLKISYVKSLEVGPTVVVTCELPTAGNIGILINMGPYFEYKLFTGLQLHAAGVTAFQHATMATQY
jgi:hypothetical protein